MVFSIVSLLMTTSNITASGSLKSLAKAGLIAKGVVYCLTGILALLATFNMAGVTSDDAGKGGIFRAVHEQPFGKVLLGTIAIGLLCYSAWRFVMAIKDTENKGSDAKGMARRIGYLFSGVIYLSLCIIAARQVLQDKESSGGGKQQLAGEVINQPFGVWILGIAALVMFGIGMGQIHLALSGKYKKYVEKAGHGSDDTRRMLLRSGQVGYTARGLVWLVVGWLFLKAAWHSNASEAGDTSKAFQWLHSGVYGDIILAVVSLGLICYGVFMFLRARYQPIHTT